MVALAGNFEIAAELVSLCRQRGLTIATAESLTAGLCAASIAGVPGASAVLRGGLIVYATDLKHEIAGVERELLAEKGPVDPQVARQLARGAAQKCGADIGIGLTGVAGPDPQDGHEVGEVFVAVSYEGHSEVHNLQFGTEILEIEVARRRDFIREQSVKRGLIATIHRLKG